jgi:hypothetical protein
MPAREANRSSQTSAGSAASAAQPARCAAQPARCTRGNALLQQLTEIDAYSEVVFSAVLFAHAKALDRSVLYATKALHNIEQLQTLFKNCTIVLYYDESVSKNFMEHIVKLANVVLVFVDHNFTEPTTIMLSRLLELDRCRKRWTVLLDVHDELEKQFNFKKGVQDAVVRVVKDGREFVRIPVYSDGIPPKCAEFPKRIPCRIIDAAGFGISQGLKMNASIESTITQYLSSYKYTYGDDEYLIDQWLMQTYQWDQVRPDEVQEVATDGEYDMQLNGLLVLDPEPLRTKYEANTYADEVLDWTAMPQGSKRTSLSYRNINTVGHNFSAARR